jgi:large subunit ribosomal protein L6
MPIPVAKGVSIDWKEHHLTVSGPKGKLARSLHPSMELEIADGIIRVKPPEKQEGFYRALFGLTRTLIFNMVHGVTEGFEKRLEIRGIGYRGQVEKNVLTLFVGYSHPVEYKPPVGITLETPKPTIVVVKGIDKELVGAVAAELRFVRKPEVYKGKGIRYEGEVVRTKVGKAGAAASGGGAKK